MPTVFISRNLRPNSPFQALLSAAAYQVHGESLLHFEAIAFDDFPTTDWIFFYSKNAVRFFFKQLEKQGKTVPTSTKYAAIGKGTAAVLESFQIALDFVGTGQPVDTAAAFSHVAAGLKVLFPRASTSHQSIQKLLAKDIVVEDLIVYHNSTKEKNKQSEVFDYLVFTSSMNARAYFKINPYQSHQKVIAIGASTAQTLNDLGVNRVVVASQTTEEAMAAAVLAK